MCNICPLPWKGADPLLHWKNSCRGHFLFANDAKCVQVNHGKFSLPLKGQLGWKDFLSSIAYRFSSVLFWWEMLSGHDWHAPQITSPQVREARAGRTIGAFIWDHKCFHGTKPAEPRSVATQPDLLWLLFLTEYHSCHSLVENSKTLLLSLLNTQGSCLNR